MPYWTEIHRSKLSLGGGLLEERPNPALFRIIVELLYALLPTTDLWAILKYRQEGSQVVR